jgi:hypothetical protein
MNSDSTDQRRHASCEPRDITPEAIKEWTKGSVDDWADGRTNVSDERTKVSGNVIAIVSGCPLICTPWDDPYALPKAN